MITKNISNPLVRFFSVNDEAHQFLNGYVDGYLMNREKLGVPLRKKMVNILTTLNEETLIIDFSNIVEMTTSVSEEICPKLFKEFLDYRISNENVYIAYCNVSDDIARGLQGTLRDWKSRAKLSSKLSFL